MNRTNFTLPIFFENAKSDVNFLYPPEPSGSILSHGMYRAADADPSGSTLDVQDNLIDENYTTPVVSHSGSMGPSGSIDASGSIGVDLGDTTSINRLVLYDDGTAGSGLYPSGSNGTLQGYYSADNASWYWFQDFYPLRRECYSGSYYKTTCKFRDAQSSRYFKLFMNSGYLRGNNGTTFEFTEIAAHVIVDAVRISGSSSGTTYPGDIDDPSTPPFQY